ncbi:Zinc finger BED domain-containing protein 5 [Frankliniella fusca]|uniref:Zinc finger BED domain-containing protein 5 n=1 Tax=Frankliniella fusca TaxID=407009 RepID=A0AAE1HZM1_9NEOP|nr:Zinc finger BED domain-containing protein 5 [Frankliniella fusca]KAK3929446.1 Zinc finger BED domain-containing protein 5 [Frankliniella fusca]
MNIDEILEEQDVDEPDGEERERPGTPTHKKRRRGELSAKEKAADAKRKEKKFTKKWLEDAEFRGWVKQVEGDPSKVLCKACNTSLAAGKSELQKHAKTDKHKNKVKSLQGVKNIASAFRDQQEPAETAAQRTLKQNIKTAEIKMAAFFSEHNVSIMSSDHLVELAKSCFPDSQIAQNMTLDRTKCTAIIQSVLGVVEKEDLSKDLRETKFSVLVDESTDRGNVKNLVIVVHYVCPSTGQTVTALFELVELDPKDCSAEAIFGRFQGALEKHGIPLTNIIGLACDNANVMTGRNNSFYSRLKAICPWLILINCICHSLAIAASHACKKLPSNIEALVRRVGNYVSSSPKRSAILEEFQEFYHNEKLKLLNPSRTRWLVLQPCVVRLLDNMQALVEFFSLCAFEDQKDREAPTIVEELRNPFNKAYLLFLKYTLEHFNKVNALFQSEQVLVHKLQEASMTYLKQFCLNYMRDSVVPSVATIDVTHPHFQKRLEDVYLGPGVNDALNAIPLPECAGMTKEQLEKRRDQDVEAFRKKCLDFYLTGAKEMKNYLPINNRILKEAGFIDPKVAMSGAARTTLPDLKDIATNFKVPLDLDCDAVAREWRELPYALSEQEVAGLRDLDPPEFWKHVGQMKDYTDELRYPQLSKLARVTLSLPHSNAAAERAFSQVTDIKTAKRNAMGNCTLDSLCVVRSAMKRKKVPCFKFSVRKEHLNKHNKDMYRKSDQ